MNLTINSQLKLVPISIQKDRKNFIVENLASGEFYEMPEVCIDAIELINQGESLGEIEGKLKENYPSEEIGILDFIEQLLELDLVEEIDGVMVELQQKEKERLGFQWISPKLGKFFFNRTAIILYFILFISNIILLIAHPDLFPHYKDIFIFKLMVLNIPTWIVVSIVLVFVHEMGHILAMRAHNLPTRLEIGHRLFLVVLETDMSSVWKLSSKNRNVLYLAGLCFDTLILFGSLASQLMMPNTSVIFIGILQMIVLSTFIRMLYQCCIYMKTDLYFVFENSTGCYNLMENAQSKIRKFLRNNSAKSEVVFEGEQKIVSQYAFFYFVGIALTMSLYFIYYIPQMIYAFRKIIPGFTKSPTTLPFWDATLFIIQVFLGFGLLVYSWNKKRIKD